MTKDSLCCISFGNWGYGLGRNKAYAISEAISANQLLLNADKVKPLTERIDGQGTVYFHEFLDRYEEILKTRGLRERTLKDYKSKVLAIRKGILDAPIENISTKMITDFIHTYIINGKTSSARIFRITLKDIFNEAFCLGIINSNHALPIKSPKVKIQRTRLSLDDFNLILKSIGDESHWLTIAMKLALVTGQRVSDIAKLKWEDMHDGKLWIVQQKTETKIVIPLKIQIVNIKLSTILGFNKNNSEYIVNNEGKKVSTEKISRRFAKLRDKTNLTWDGSPPSFHEIRSLSPRLYTEENGSEFARKMLGHKSAEMTAKYQDDRNNSWIEI